MSTIDITMVCMNSGKEKTGNFISPTQKVVDTIKNRLFYNYAPELVVELDVFLENGTKVGGEAIFMEFKSHTKFCYKLLPIVVDDLVISLATV